MAILIQFASERTFVFINVTFAEDLGINTK